MDSKTKSNKRKNLEFVEVPIIADHPKYGWHIVGRDEFSSAKKCVKAIKKIGVYGRE